jgi:Fic family protein
LERELLAKSLSGRLAMDGISVPLEQVLHQLKVRTAPSQDTDALTQEVEFLLVAWQVDRLGIRTDRPSITAEHIQALHAQLTSETSGGKRLGNWRSQPIGTNLVDGVPPEVIGLFTEELCDWLNGPELHAPTPEETLPYSLIRMLVTELYLAWIHPFSTAHGRLLGAVAQTLLAQDGTSSVAGHLANIHFHRHGREYQRQVIRAAEGPADPIAFISFGLRGIAEGARELHARVREIQVNGQWRAQLLDLFNNAEDGPTRRQRQLLLDLGSAPHPVPLGELPDLSTALAKLYAGVSEKTLRRDVDALTAVGVLRRTRDGLSVERGNLLAFKH